MYVCIYLSIVHPSSIHPSIHPCIHPSIHPSISLLVCQTVIQLPPLSSSYLWPSAIHYDFGFVIFSLPTSCGRKMICSRVQICVFVRASVSALARHSLKDDRSAANKQDICLNSCITWGETLWKCAVPRCRCRYCLSPCDSQDPHFEPQIPMKGFYYLIYIFECSVLGAKRPVT